jgi:phenylacetate-CoA ligase
MDKGMSDQPTDQERYPTLTEAGQRMLKDLREHPSAPIYRNQSGNRLSIDDVKALRVFEQKVLAAAIDFLPNQAPAWVNDYVQRAFEDVPYYRSLGSPPRNFTDLPTLSRADLAADIAKFVPNSISIDRLINFRTTGTTGHPLLIASHPLVAARYLTFHKRALKRFGIELKHGRNQVGVVLLGYQRKCFTYVSVTPLMDESGLAKINLHPADWNHPEDRGKYLDALATEVYAGDPISFTELLKLPLSTKPRALISVSMALSAGLRAMLEARFECPVLDVYSMNEVGPVAVYDPQAGGHVLLQPQLYVEILDPSGHPVPSGQHGEIVVTGGFNFCLPLIRYRTGDFGALAIGNDGPVIIGLLGRQPIRFRTSDGRWLNNIDVSHALGAIAFSRFGLHQHADGSLAFSVAITELSLAEKAKSALKPLFGDQSITVIGLIAEDKFLQYTSDLEGAKQ